MAASSGDREIEALRRLRTTDATRWLAPADDLPAAARAASRHAFSSLKPYAPKSPFERLLTEGFDHEQVWQQIDLQTQPLLASLRREVRRLEKDPTEIRKIRVPGSEEGDREKGENLVMETEASGDEDEESEEDDDGDEDGDDDDNNGLFEDKFLKMKEMDDFADDVEAREYGLERKDKDKKKKSEESDEEEDSDEDEEEDEEDMFGELGIDGGDEDGEDDPLANARYEDFFGDKKEKPSKREAEVTGDVEDAGSSDEEFDDEDDGTGTFSTHEKERMKNRMEIEKMEQESLKPKNWNMLGEVTAAQRPKNSALELDLEFEHNVRPPPVITEEITASLEDLIKNRVLEGQFDDVQKPPTLSSNAPRKVKELDENKSKKGLAEVYEEEYVQKTNLAATSLSFADEEKQEASMLFKKLCLKLDALSHFHFAPKPIIEDMSLPENVPALAMEEVAPVAVSDAAMLAPEEVFAGKGNIKDETELTQTNRKRRRAHKKRKFKAEMAKRAANKPPESKLASGNNAEVTTEVTKKARLIGK